LYFDNGQLDTMMQIDTSGYYPFVNPQVQNPYTHVMVDTVNWSVLSGTFVADGTEEYLTIGNFLPLNKTDTIVLDTNRITKISCVLIDDVSVYPIDAHNWLHDTSGTLGDSTIIGLPNYEVPDGQWFTINMVPLGTGSQIKVKNTQPITQYIQAVDVCNSVIYDTMTVYAYPLSNSELLILNSELKVHPNPATNVIEVSHAIGQQVFLYNAVGAFVAKQQVMQNKAVLQVGHLTKGVYVVKTAGQVGKVVVQ
jgi:hypothetical protein